MSTTKDSAAYESLWMKELLAFQRQSHILQMWEPLSYLDKGQFSRIFKIRHRQNGMLAALKYVPNPTDVSDCAEEGSQSNAFHRSCFEQSKHEVKIMSRFHGEKYIAQYLEKPEFLRRTFTDRSGKEVVQYAVLICMPLYRNSKEWLPFAQKIPDVRLQLGLNIARALVAFEKKGVYHRDIKPGNIMLDKDGRFCLSDVGEAKLESDFTTVGFHGTRPYMAPEVLRLEGERGRMRSDHRSDLYSLGIVLYKLYNYNQFPFLAENGALTESAARSYQKYEKRIGAAGKVLYMTDSERARRLRYDGLRLSAPAQADAAMSRIILKACAYSQKDRYQRAMDLYVDLREYAQNRAAAGKAPVRRRKRSWRRQAAVLCTLAAMGLVCCAGLLIHRIAPAPEISPSPTVFSSPSAAPAVTETAVAPMFSPTPTIVTTPGATAKTPAVTPAFSPAPAAPQPELRLNQSGYSVQTDGYLRISWNELPIETRYAVNIYRQGEDQPLRSVTTTGVSACYHFTEPGDYHIEVQAVNDQWEPQSEKALADISVTQGEPIVESGKLRLQASQTKVKVGEMVDFTVSSDTDEIVLIENEAERSVQDALDFFQSGSSYQTGLGMGSARQVHFYALTSDGRRSNQVTVTWAEENEETTEPLSSGYLPGDQIECDGMTFCLQEDQTWTVESGAQSLTEAVIPSTLEGLPVTAITKNAFKQCRRLQSLTIGEGIRSIGDHAFRNCSRLQTVSLPDSLTELGASAFAYCTSLQEITLPSGLTQIPFSAFGGCMALQTVHLPDGLIKIEKEAFKECRKLRTVTLPDGVTAIGDQAFYHCDSLGKVYLPESLRRIGRDAFSSSAGLLENLVFCVPKYKDSYAESYARQNRIPCGYYIAD